MDSDTDLDGRRAMDSDTDLDGRRAMDSDTDLDDTDQLLEAVPQEASCAEASSRTLNNFYLMSALFSISHGSVTALIGMTSSVYLCVPWLANLSGIAYWGCFSVSALAISTPVVIEYGAKRCLFYGLLLNCLFAGSFLVIDASECSTGALSSIGTDRATINVLAAALAGTGAGLMWTAQGKYFQHSAALFAQQTNVPAMDATMMFAGIFSGILLGFEFLMKLLTSLLQVTSHLYFISFFLVGVAASLASLQIADLEVPTVKPVQKWYTILHLAVDLFSRDVNVRLLTPFPLVFGFAVIYMNFDMNQRVITDGPVSMGLGLQAVGYAQCILVGSAAIGTQIIGRVFGKQASLVLAFTSLGLWASAPLICGFEPLQNWIAVIPLYVLFGIMRSIYETSHKAVFADFFPEEGEAAFAVLSFAMGTAATTAFVLRQLLPPTILALLIVGMCLIGNICCTIVFRRQADGMHTPTTAT